METKDWIMGQRSDRHFVHVAMAVLAAVITTTMPLAATEACGEHADSDHCPEQLGQINMDALFASDMTSERIDTRSASKPWIAQNWSSAPFALTQSGTELQMQASLEHLGGYANTTTARRYEDAKALAPQLVMPKPVASAPLVLDVWSSIDVKGDERDAQTLRSQVGADYMLTPHAMLGIATEVTKFEDVTMDTSGDGQRIFAYMAFRPIKPIVLDAKAAWGEAVTSSAHQEVSETQTELSARVRGDLKIATLKLSPMLSIVQDNENASPSAGGSTEHRTIIVEPRVSRPFHLGSGSQVEPFMRYKGEIDIDKLSAASGNEQTAVEELVGGGITLVKPDAYSLAVTTDLGNLGESEKTTLDSRVQVKIPLR